MASALEHRQIWMRFERKSEEYSSASHPARGLVGLHSAMIPGIQMRGSRLRLCKTPATRDAASISPSGGRTARGRDHPCTSSRSTRLPVPIAVPLKPQRPTARSGGLRSPSASPVRPDFARFHDDTPGESARRSRVQAFARFFPLTLLCVLAVFAVHFTSQSTCWPQDLHAANFLSASSAAALTSHLFAAPRPYFVKVSAASLPALVRLGR